MHTPGANGRPRGSSIAASNKCLQCKGKRKSGEIRSKTSGSSTPVEADHQEESHCTRTRSSPASEARYECNSSRRHVAAARGMRSQPFRPASPDSSSGETFSRVLGSYAPDPPVTQTTLSELDVPRIIFNPKLRHDVNFDPDLHFRPNLDGEKGRRKSQRAADFWNCLRAQIEAFISDREAFEAECGGREWCLPATLRSIGEILETLVPPEDRLSVVEVLNVELLMQEFSKGAADLERLALWLARTLKSHCAPMRDEWVDEMVTQLTIGNREQDVGKLVQGLQTLLAVLEAMKLDVANHQIRCLRPLLIQDTISFEQTFFMKKIAAGRLDVTSAHDWFLASEQLHDQHYRKHGDVWTLMKGFVNLLLPSNAGNEVPDTFTFDEDRVAKLRSDVLDAVNLHVCVAIFRKLCATSTATSCSLDSTRTGSGSPFAESLSSSRSPSPRSASHTYHSAKSSSPTLSLHEFDRDSTDSPRLPRDTAWSRHSSFPDPFIASSLPGSFSLPTSSVSLSSPTNSSFWTKEGSSTGQTPNSSVGFESKLRQSLTALLDVPCQSASSPSSSLHSSTCSSPSPSPPQRWTSAIPSLALEILRHTPIELSHLPSFENYLSQHLSCPSSPLFRTAEASVLSSLYAMLDDLLESYLSLSTMDLFEAVCRGGAAIALASGLSSGSGLASAEREERYGRWNVNFTGEEKELGEIARLVAHVGILHWRVWAPLVYLVNPDTEMEDGDEKRGRALKRGRSHG